MRRQEPITVKILDINRGHSRANCKILYNSKIYDNVSLPSNIRKGTINDSNFYYDKENNEVFSKNIGENAFRIGIILFIFSLFLWLIPNDKFKL